MSDKRKRRDIAIYKANQKQTGSVIQIKLANNNDCMFLECANQNAPMDAQKPYDWENKIVVKLGESDICKMLAYFKLETPSTPLKLYHQSPDGSNKGVELKWQEYGGRPSYYLTVTHQQNKGDKPNRVGIPIGLDEVEYIRIGFEKALAIFLSWD